MREVLDRNGWKNPVLREFKAENEIIVRVKEFENNAQGVGERMQTALNAELPDTRALLRIEGVGAGMGVEFAGNQYVQS